MARLPNFWVAPAKLGSQKFCWAEKLGTGGEAVGHQLERVGMPAEAAMCELAAELKKAEAMQPLAAMRMLGELACMETSTTSCSSCAATTRQCDSSESFETAARELAAAEVAAARQPHRPRGGARGHERTRAELTNTAQEARLQRRRSRRL